MLSLKEKQSFQNDLKLYYIVLSSTFLLPTWHKRRLNVEIIYLILNTQALSLSFFLVINTTFK